MRLAIVNGTLLDTERMEMAGERHLVIDDDLIVDVVEGGIPAAEVTIDARGQYVLPGLIDAHVHLAVTSMNFASAAQQSGVESALWVARAAEATVRRGFTTVRDTGGDTGGLVKAIASGLCDGPRIVRAGKVLSQTGGHGDIRSTHVDAPLCGGEIVTSA